MNTERVEIIVNGKVQGVFFRASTVGKAEELNIKGWVRNLNDGSVEITAEGRSEDISEFIKWCEKGPANANVTEINVERLAPTGEFSNFYIKY